nr:hypothetical protein [Tanacetum cinerariifolium]
MDCSFSHQDQRGCGGQHINLAHLSIAEYVKTKAIAVVMLCDVFLKKKKLVGDKIWYDEVHYLTYFEKEFPAIVYNDALTSKSDFSPLPIVSPQHIDEVNLKNETSLSECDGE